MKNKYFAFISYKREDEEWAIWFQHELEYYHLPASLNGRRDELDIPNEFRPVFRDIDELKAGRLSTQISDALSNSTNLVVICSPNCASHPEWVNKEIKEFVRTHKKQKDKDGNNIAVTEHIFPLIVEGIPHSKEDKTKECFPSALMELSKSNDLLGGNVNETGRDKAFVKVLAGMLPKVGFADLWDRYGRDKAEQERKEREDKEKLQIAQSRFVAEKVNGLLEEGDSYTSQKLCLEVLPNDEEQMDRPYVFSAELALRKARAHMLNIHNKPTALLHLNKNARKLLCFYKNDEFLIVDSYTGISVINITNGKLITLKESNGYFSSVSKCEINNDIVTYSQYRTNKPILIWHLDEMSYKEINRYMGGQLSVVFCHGTNNILINNGHDCYLYDVEKDTYNYYKCDSGDIISIIPQKDLMIIDKENAIEFWTISTNVLLFGTKSLVQPRRRSRKIVHYNIHDDYIVVTDHNGILVFSIRKDHEIKVANRIKMSQFHDESIVIIPHLGFCYIYKKEVMFWSCQSKRKTIIVESPLDILHISYCELSKEIVFSCSDGSISFYDLCKKSITAKLTKVGVDFVISNDGKRIASIKNNNVISYYNRSIDNFKEKAFEQCLTLISKENCLYLYQGNKIFGEYKGHKDQIRKFQLSKNGKCFFSLSLNGNRVLIWNPKSKKHRTSPISVCPLSDFSFSDSSYRLAIMQRDGLFYEYDINEERIIKNTQFDYDDNSILSYGTNGKVLGIYSNNALYVRTGDEIKKTAINDRISAMCFNYSDTELYVGTLDGYIYKYDVSLNKCESMSDNGCSDIVEKILLSLNGQYVVIQARRSVWVYDNNSKTFSRMGEYMGLVLDSSICPNSRFLATYSVASHAEHVIRLWDLKLKTCQILERNTKAYFSLRFSLDGNYLRGLSSDGVFSYWETLSLNNLRKYTEQIFKDNPLTQAERIQYYIE